MDLSWSPASSICVRNLYKKIYIFKILCSRIYFGEPSLKDYFDRKTEIVTTFVPLNLENIPAPSITVTRKFNKRKKTFYQEEATNCTKFTNQTFKQCVESTALDISNVIQDSGPQGKKKYCGNWTQKYNQYDGWYYEMISTKTLADKDCGGVNFVLNRSVADSFNLYIHDSNDYVMNMNKLEVFNGNNIYGMGIKQIKMIKNCNPLPKYSFKNCVENYVSKRFGCKSQLVKVESYFLQNPVCNNEEQLREGVIYCLLSLIPNCNMSP